MEPNNLFTLSVSAILFIGLFFLNSCSEKQNEKEEEKEIAISELPAVVVSIIQDTLPGFVITEAEIEGTGQDMIYDVEGTMDGKEYDVEVTPEGKIIEIDQENDEENDADGESDDDDNDKENHEEETNHDDDRSENQ